MVSPDDSLLVERIRIIPHPAEFFPGLDGSGFKARLFRRRRWNGVRRFGALFTWRKVERRRRVLELVTKILKPLQTLPNEHRRQKAYVDRPELARS